MKQTTSVHGKGTRPEGMGEFREVVHDVAEVSARLRLPPEIKRRALTLCSEMRTGSFERGVPRNVLATATLYVACRELKSTVTLRELAAATNLDPRVIGRCYLDLLENMHISRPSLNGKGYVYHIPLKRPIPEEVLKQAQEIINLMSLRGLGGRNPMTLAAAALYLASCNLGENVTQAEVAEAAGVGEESVRECCKEIRTLARPP